MVGAKRSHCTGKGVVWMRQKKTDRKTAQEERDREREGEEEGDTYTPACGWEREKKKFGEKGSDRKEARHRLKTHPWCGREGKKQKGS